MFPLTGVFLDTLYINIRTMFIYFLSILSSKEGQYWAQNSTGHLLITYLKGFHEGSCQKKFKVIYFYTNIPRKKQFERIKKFKLKYWEKRETPLPRQTSTIGLYLIPKSVQLGLIKSGLSGAKLAWSARIHLQPDLVTLFCDVADAVKLVTTNLMSLTELPVRECGLNFGLLKPCFVNICQTLIFRIFRR